MSVSSCPVRSADVATPAAPTARRSAAGPSGEVRPAADGRSELATTNANRRATADDGRPRGRRWLRIDPPHEVVRPRVLLYVTSHSGTESGTPGSWQFALCRPNGELMLVAADQEPEMGADRLALLAVVRGLEALDEPSEVELVTSSPYVRRGIAFGIAQWRRTNWMWEAFGQMVPINNTDLWRRVDRAMRIHRVECRRWHVATDTDVPLAGGAAAETLVETGAATDPFQEATTAALGHGFPSLGEQPPLPLDDHHRIAAPPSPIAGRMGRLAAFANWANRQHRAVPDRDGRSAWRLPRLWRRSAVAVLVGLAGWCSAIWSSLP